MSTIDERACGKSECDNFGKPGRNIVGHGWSNSRRLQRRPRYADPVFVLSVPPHTLQRYRRRRPDFVANQVASLRVEGVSISATARVRGHSHTTIVRWLERASTAAARFNHLWVSNSEFGH